jgi:3',5'-cyclic AMP phosphodiesterase CpdA
VFVLAHLSDPHLHPPGRPRWRDLASKRGLGFINWEINRRRHHDMAALAALVDDLRAHRPDHVAVIGDLTVIGHPDEYVPARAFLARLGSPEDVSLVPGNHDSYVRATWHHPRLHWSDYMRGDAAAGHGAPRFPYLRRRGPLAIIGVSTAVPTAPFSATGRVGAGQAVRLRRLLEGLRGEGLFRVVLIHHPPMPDAARLRRLVDAGAVAAAIGEGGAELVLHGHNHRMQHGAIAGSCGRAIPVVGVPSASAGRSALGHSAAYNLYEIERSGQGWRCVEITRGLGLAGTIVERARQVLIGE